MKRHVICIFAVMLMCGGVHAGPLKVFILAGQSNMQGHGIIKANPKRNGGKGSLEYLVKSPKTTKRFKHLINAKGKWVARKDVWIWHFDRKGPLTVGYGARKHLIGPELQFGHVVGDHIDNQVLLIETSWGGRSLAAAGEPLGPSGQVDERVLEVLAGPLHGRPVGIRREADRVTVHEDPAGHRERDLKRIPGPQSFFLEAAKATGTIGAPPSRAASTTPIWTT